MYVQIIICITNNVQIISICTLTLANTIKSRMYTLHFSKTMHCNTRQRTATHGNALQHTATHGNTRQYTVI